MNFWIARAMGGAVVAAAACLALATLPARAAGQIIRKGCLAEVKVSDLRDESIDRYVFLFATLTK
ncbi:hypothetical protein KXR53_14380 [Inquilinus limosus]|uniref:hypothetical protein n=1 Tax=Inquilinus limosus TaxID=171674 RepID=UPI003F136D72